jgi:PTH1 family peptidyl-tRNA hydrolase
MYTLVPLGNRGEEYAKTRHNAARIVTAHMKLDDKRAEIFIPDGFMNESGFAVSEHLRYHNNRELIVMYDDKDLPLGTFRIAFDRSAGGHNGLKSIIDTLGRTDFIRIRIGIAPKETDGDKIIPPHGKGVQDYVLRKMNEEEMSALVLLAPTIKEAIMTILESGYKKAMEKFN